MLPVEWTIESQRGHLAGWKYLWLKTVDGFNTAHHCARCLVGSYSKHFSPRMDPGKAYGEQYQPGQLLYFCGVSAPYRWPNNMHLAGVVEAGAECRVELYTGDVLVVRNLRRIEFDDRAARERFPERGAEFLTCRNFQFAAQVFPDA